MKHLKLFNSLESFNNFVFTGNYITPIVAKINKELLYKKKDLYNCPYQRIEYLESTGTQWIDTLFQQNDIEKFSIKYYSANSSDPGYGNAMGCRNRSNANEFQVSNYNQMISIGTRNTSMGNVQNQINEIIYTGGDTININGTIKSINVNFSNLRYDYHIMLFGIYQYYSNGITQLEATKIYYVTLEGNGKKIHLIPVRIGNIGYMYDTVSKQLFSNQGTGQFILGPDIA